MKQTLSQADAQRAAQLKHTAEENDRVLRLLAQYLNLTPRLLDTKMVTDLAKECNITIDEAFRALFSAACGLNVPDDANDRRIERLYFRQGLHRLSPADYRNDPYTKQIRFSDLSVGKWRFTHGSYHAFEPFVCGHPIVTPDFREIPQIGYFESDFSFPSVTENGVEWMTVTPNEIETMREPIAQAHGRVLTYGLGLGYFAFHVAEKPDTVSVTVVERDVELIKLFQAHILPQFPHREKLRIVTADAFAFTEQHMSPADFDTAFIDLWHDQSDGLALYLRMKRLESRFPKTVFSYWIEPTILSSIRHMVLDRIFACDNSETAPVIRSYAEIEAMLTDEYLRALAPKLRQLS